MVNSGESEFQQLYETYQPRILRYLTRLAGPDEAQDLSQEVFLRASRGLRAFRGEAQLSTWLYRIATHAAIDRSRSASFRHRVQDGLPEESEAAAAREAWTGEEPASLEKLLLQKDRARCFMRFVDDLPVNYRFVLLLSEIEELTTREIAAVLGLSQETVKIRLHRGRARLFKALREHCKPEEWL